MHNSSPIQRLDMLIRTSNSVLRSIAQGKQIDKEEALRLIKTEQFTSLMREFGLIQGMGPHGSEKAELNRLLHEQLERKNIYNYSVNIYHPHDFVDYKNGLHIFADLLNRLALDIVSDLAIVDSRSKEESNQGSYILPTTFDYFDDSYELHQDDEIDVEAEGWEHLKEYNENHD